MVGITCISPPSLSLLMWHDRCRRLRRWKRV
jgi:hypothetical protein